MVILRLEIHLTPKHLWCFAEPYTTYLPVATRRVELLEDCYFKVKRIGQEVFKNLP